MEGWLTDKALMFSRLNGYSFEQRKIIHLLFDKSASLEQISLETKLPQTEVTKLIAPLIKEGIIAKR